MQALAELQASILPKMLTSMAGRNDLLRQPSVPARTQLDAILEAGRPRTVVAGATVEAPTPATSTVNADKTDKKKLYVLDKSLGEGALHDELKEIYKKLKKPVVDRIRVDENVAGAVKHFYEYNKPIKVLKELSRQYTGLADIPEARIQLLNDEIKFQEARMRCCGQRKAWWEHSRPYYP